VGAGWNIIQSKNKRWDLVVLYGKGWLERTQASVRLSARKPYNFISLAACRKSSVCWAVGLILAYLLVITRGLYISRNGQAEQLRQCSQG